MNYRLQFTHHSEVFESRSAALKYISDIYNPSLAARVADTVYAEPYVVQYTDPAVKDGKPQVILAIGRFTESGDVADADQYQVIDSANLEQDMENLSAATVELKAALEQEIKDRIAADNLEISARTAADNLEISARTKADEYLQSEIDDMSGSSESIQKELDNTQKGAGLQEDGSYKTHVTTGTDVIKYIDSATSLDAADVALDKAIQSIAGASVSNIVVNDVTGTVKDNIAEVTIDTDDIKLDEDYETTRTNIEAKGVHPLHNEEVLSDALAQLEVNYNDEIAQIAGLHIVKITDELPSNVQEAYDLVDRNGTVQTGNARINIYKDSSLYKVYVGDMGDELEDDTDPESIKTGTTGVAALCFIYLKADGKYQLVRVDVGKFLEESEFEDGLTVTNHVVRVKVDDASEKFLTSNYTADTKSGSIKLTGVQDAIDAAKTEAEKYTDDEIATAKTDVETYTDNKVAAAQTEDKKYTDDQIATAKTEVEKYTDTEIEKVNNTIKSITVASKDKTVTVNTTTDGTDLSVNIDKKTLVESDGVISAGLTLKELPASEISSDTLAGYKLADNAGNYIAGSAEIDVPKQKILTVEDESLPYLKISSAYTLSAKVNEAGGLGGYDLLKETNDAVKVLNGDVATAGSVKHTIDDELVAFTGGTAESANKTLMREYVDPSTGLKYYVSNDTSDMEYKGQNLESVISSISGNGGTVKEDLAALSAETIVIEEGLASATTRIETLEKTTEKLTTDLSELSATTIKIEDSIESATTRIEKLETGLTELSATTVVIEEGLASATTRIETLETNLSELSATTVMLESGLTSATTRIEVLEEGIASATTRIETLESGLTSATTRIETLETQMASANTRIKTLENDLTTVSGQLYTLITNMEQTIKDTVKSYLTGTSREISVGENADGKLQIGFTDDAVFGPISLS